jgi:hypothetical protein
VTGDTVFRGSAWANCVGWSGILVARATSGRGMCALWRGCRDELVWDGVVARAPVARAASGSGRRFVPTGHRDQFVGGGVLLAGATNGSGGSSVRRGCGDELVGGGVLVAGAANGIGRCFVWRGHRNGFVGGGVLVAGAASGTGWCFMRMGSGEVPVERGNGLLVGGAASGVGSCFARRGHRDELVGIDAGVASDGTAGALRGYHVGMRDCCSGLLEALTVRRRPLQPHARRVFRAGRWPNGGVARASGCWATLEGQVTGSSLIQLARGRLCLGVDDSRRWELLLWGW